MHLKGAVSKHGGRTTPFLSVRGVTHIIAENLSGMKTHKSMKVRYSYNNDKKTICRSLRVNGVMPRYFGVFLFFLHTVIIVLLLIVAFYVCKIM